MKNKAYTLIEISVIILILGILISGVSTGLDLYLDYKIIVAKNLTQNSRVNRIDDLVLWLESSQKTSFLPDNIKNGDRITKWKNISPNLSPENQRLNDANPSSLGPKFSESVVNSLPSLDFNNSENNNLWVRSGFDGNGKNSSIYLVLKTKPNWTNVNQPRLLERSYNYSIASMWSLRTNVFVHNSSLGVHGYFGTYTIDPNSLVLYELIINRGDKIYFNIYGDFKFTGQKNDNFDGPYYQLGLSISSYVDAFYSEIIVFDRAINVSERQSVRDYLTQKWGIKK